jgi:hypothetical protein
MADEPNAEPSPALEPSATSETETPTVPAAIPPEILDKLPPEQREFLQTFLAFGTFPIHNPMLAQVRPEHITKLLDNQAKAADLEAQDRHEARNHTTALTIAMAIIVAAVILALALTNHSTDLGTVLQYGFPFLGGVGGGYALAEWRHRGD